MEEKISEIMRAYDGRIMTPTEWNHYMRKFNLALEKQDWELFHKTKQELIAAYAG
jgi:hypothetical protein